ncbi:hypothetical protein StoSoilB20_08210 [Arthrobacter sp. StoSoilB20]|nr:hypothetical protein StoSoilB20_08210 [Arthrobacter sp. StoSoilB20]
MSGAHEQSDAENRLPAHVRFSDEQDEGEDDEDKAHRDKKQWRNFPAVGVQAEVDGNEIDAPEDGDQDGEGRMAKVHKYTLTSFSVKHQR